MDADNDTAGLPDTPLQGNRNPLSKDHHTQKHPAEQNPANLNFTEDHLPGEHSSHETSTDKDPTKSLSDGDIRTEDLGNQDHTTEEHPEITASCGEEGVDRDCSSPISLVDLFNEDIISNIGTYAVQQAFGPEFHGIIPSSALNEAVEELISNLAAFIVDSDDVRTHFTGRSEGDGTHGHAAPTSGGGKSSLKRKATGGDGVESGGQGGGNGDDGGDGMSGDGSGRRNGKHTPPANIKDLGHGRFEFMCPFRLKDPLRFNVRDWYDCATKVYVCEESSSKRNELNELRRHLKLKHARPGAPSPPYCSKCKEEFPTEMRLDDHAKQETCTYRELFMSNDPLDGLTQDAERELSSKQGRQGASAMTQYRQICHIVLGADSEVPSPGE
ncbi:hypothetical protein QBC44DRAFT_244036 [Cladorrhinum sp. PSN332]|nr:hypothetical protein QBC44DRAFT_244036 [Cladorrhinum sp. PSN332]